MWAGWTPSTSAMASIPISRVNGSSRIMSGTCWSRFSRRNRSVIDIAASAAVPSRGFSRDQRVQGGSLQKPGKIICVGRNYAAHARELGNDVPDKPLLFFKPPSSVIEDGDSIVLPPLSKQVEH